MDAALASRIEDGIDRAAAACFAAACGYAAYRWLGLYVGQPQLGAEAIGAAALAYLCCTRALLMAHPRQAKLPIPVFDLRDYELPQEQPELLLTDRHEPAPQAAGALVLDDILAELGPDARVVRLFDPAAMPTPSELVSRIDRHLDHQSAPRNQDATQALHEALAELRRSIR